MISNKDRSGWFGASESQYIIGNYETKSFKNWWLEKLGLRENNFTNSAMKTGSYYEHKILDAVAPYARKDYQILIPELKLRVNLDGDTEDMIYEVKTYNAKDEFKISPYYKHQLQIQMFAKQIKRAAIISYGLSPEDYRNFFNGIDLTKINLHSFNYNERFIKEEFLPKLRYLCDCLEKTVMPKNNKI